VNEIVGRLHSRQSFVQRWGIQNVTLEDLRGFLDMESQLIGIPGQTPEFDRLLFE
jgi:hypothetical protein